MAPLVILIDLVVASILESEDGHLYVLELEEMSEEQ